MRKKLLSITLSAMFGALLYASQIAFAALPNIELVSLFILVWTRVFRSATLPGIAVFVLLQGITYGFGFWWTSYIYIWYVLWALVMLIPPARRAYTGRMALIPAVGWALLSGAYGFAFGALSSIPWFFRGGFSAMVAYTLSGIPFDVTHAIGNFVLALVLVVPLMRLLARLKHSL